MDEFGTVLNCMDGRTQRKVNDYLVTWLGVRNLDTITTAGIVRHIAEDTERTHWILSDLDVSITNHSSRNIAVAAHHDCAGNPVPDDTQLEQLAQAVGRIRQRHPEANVAGLWVDERWIATRVGGT